MRIDKSEIAGKLAMLKKVIPSKTSVECLRGILIKDCTMTANNLTTALQTPIECSPDEHFILPMKAIEMIESLPEGTVEIRGNAKEKTVHIQCGSIKNRVQSFDPGDFPGIDVLDKAESIGIESDKLEEAISTIMYAVAATATRPTVTGMMFEGDGTNLNLVAMDGFRLAWAQLPYATPCRMIVPKPAVQMLLSLGLNGQVNVRYSSRAAVFELEEYTFFCRLLEGEYPQYQTVFPKHKNSVLIDRRMMMESLRRAMICLEDRNRPLVKVSLSGNQMTLAAESGSGDYTETLNTESPADADLLIGFNGRYLQDCFKSYRTDVVECFFGGPHAPMVVDDGDIKSLVLPVRLGANQGGNG